MRNRIAAAGLATAAALAVAASAFATGAPSIKRFVPTHGAPGARVVITGSNLLNGRVTFGGHAGLRTTSNAAGTALVAYLPQGITPGYVIVKVRTASGTATGPRKFVVNPIP
jgi:hypothetical protein